MIIFRIILGKWKWINTDEILSNSVALAGEHPSQNILLGFTIAELCKRIDVLEERIKKLEEK
jgi:hypothetical protein